ncbi:zinc-binding alcohol dehydrogenase family protein [Solemya velum gill symbiont]|uniref:Zinc-type alcohol dehydrogenase-like protein n=1 Tax=Solemya velum gill symbiont TaxID=2340 RepID=A0A0B0H8K2_SOVGS|nr:zinc-binding alcohol dehydrogenase family protein [Solemya velum gill symbiont]KHF24982.1 zinc-binding alcohol dehydrogenase family protein [Solemya velum gill symbiont]OOY50839.1 NADPH:quinone reductase [Solemya velum gill symbiont]OOY55066.1 NADPH:quinone reductase [Solemya velum gill symbiont]OOY55901.1 NADPH:quinone reductase [Solemya velum gill symbiont]OOY59454.1 NADPH:quinone reductase [Solemya velum gill symbiont]
MKAVGYTESLDIENPDSLIDIELPRPEAHGHDLLVRVSAISVNPVDAKVRKRAAPEEGSYKILGWDAVGEVIAIGDEVSAFKKGDRVWYAGDVTRDGTNAEYHLVDERIVGKAPESLSDAEAAAIPLTSVTALELLFDRLGLKEASENEAEQERLLIVGAAGGVGSIMVQLAAQLTDATVIGTASRPESEKWIMDLGADHVINHSKSFSEELKRIGVNDVTHVACLNHTDQHFEPLVEIIAPQGKFALIDDPASMLDVIKLKLKSISLHWELMFTRSMFQTDDMGKQGDMLNRVAELIDAGNIRTTLGAHYGTICADNLRRAHRDIESGKSIGKIVLEGFS